MAQHEVSLSDDSESAASDITVLPDDARAAVRGNYAQVAARPCYESLAPARQHRLREAVLEKLQELLGTGEDMQQDMSFFADLIHVELQRGLDEEQLCEELQKLLHGRTASFTSWLVRYVEGLAAEQRGGPAADAAAAGPAPPSQPAPAPAPAPAAAAAAATVAAANSQGATAAPAVPAKAMPKRRATSWPPADRGAATATASASGAVAAASGPAQGRPQQWAEAAPLRPPLPPPPANGGSSSISRGQAAAAPAAAGAPAAGCRDAWQAPEEHPLLPVRHNAVPLPPPPPRSEMPPAGPQVGAPPPPGRSWRRHGGGRSPAQGEEAEEEQQQQGEAREGRGSMGRSRSRSRSPWPGTAGGARGRGRGREDLPLRLTRWSRALSSVLRHRGPEVGVRLSPEGFASLSEVLQALGGRCSREDALEVVRRSLHRDGTPRFELAENAPAPEDPLIRATEGHTLPDIGVRGSRPGRREHSGHEKGLSRALSKVLRYEADQMENVLIMQDGFVPLSDVLRVMRRFTPRRADVERVVQRSLRKDGSPRFELKNLSGDAWIRALGRHAIQGLRPLHRPLHRRRRLG